MKLAINLAGLCWLASACIAPILAAETPSAAAAFKIRTGHQVASRRDGLDNRIMGMGLEVSMPLGGGRWFAELGYQYKSGTQYRAELGDMARRIPTTAINPDFSVDSVKNKVDGLALRLGYGMPLGSAWGWKAGMQFGGAKFTHQSLGYITDGEIGDEGNLHNASYLDTYAETHSKASVSVSPFGSLTYNLDKNSSFEFGVLLLGYKAISYRHLAGTETTDPNQPSPTYIWGGHTSQDTIQENNRLVPHLEVTYVFHF